MITFLDGPAKGVSLHLLRCPVMLRLVQNERGEWDGLDQLEDEPRPSETIHVYWCVHYRGTLHIDSRGKDGRRKGGWYKLADYRHLPEQPGEEHTRTNAAWQKWCTENRERLTAELAKVADEATGKPAAAGAKGGGT